MPAQSSRKFSGLPCAPNTGLWYTSLGFPKGIDCIGVDIHCSLQFRFSASLLSIQSKGHIFPASGYRNNSNGSLNNVGSNGYYWTATPYSTNNGRNLNFNSSNTNWNNNNRANGFPVRAVAEAFADQWTLPFPLYSSVNGHHR